VIRFNDPVSLRSFTPNLGVFVNDAYNDDHTLDHSIVHQPLVTSTEVMELMAMNPS
jgi:hypothetical protein